MNPDSPAWYQHGNVQQRIRACDLISYRPLELRREIQILPESVTWHAVMVEKWYGFAAHNVLHADERRIRNHASRDLL